jgi:tRNA C32,U32 (ribose-2'-O)-methylase TrmJ
MWYKIMSRLTPRIPNLGENLNFLISLSPRHPRLCAQQHRLVSRITALGENLNLINLSPRHDRLRVQQHKLISTSTVTTRALPDYKIARKPLEESLSEGSRFPWRDEFELSREIKLDAATVINTLAPFMTEDRLERIEKVCSKRTFDVLPIVEHPYDLGNLAAVCRSADALGCGAVHVIRSSEDERFKQSARTSGGAEKWLDIQVHQTTVECLSQVKQLGYQVVITHLRADSVPPSEIDWTKPTAVVFGNELQGVSEEAVALADACIAIPMDGFVESFNISVAAALTLWEARRIRQEKLGNQGNLTPEQVQILKAVMVLRTRGLAKQWVSHLLRRAPPEWQQHRNKGNWHGKEFEDDGEGGEKRKFSLPPPGQRKKCYFWDGECCWGEKLLFPGKQCRYWGAHNRGISTINAEKLEIGCERMGVEIPEELEALKLKLKKNKLEEVDEEIIEASTPLA